MIKTAKHTARSAIMHEQGMTLIEMMVVILILGILVALLVQGGVTQATNTARLRACQANQRSIDTAIHIYISKHRTEPSSIGDLIVDGLLKTAPQEPEGGSYTLTPGKNSAACSLGHTY